MPEFINTIDVLGDDIVADSIIDRSIVELKDDAITEVRNSAFEYCSSLATIELPNCKKIGIYSFSGCSALTEVTDKQFASLTQIGNNAFASTKIKKVSLSKLTSLGNAFAGLTSIAEIRLQAIKTLTNQCFRQCYGSVELVDLGACTYIDGYTFYGCPYIKNFVLRSETLCTLASLTGLCGFSGNTNISTKIYVPRALVDSYKAATNWSAYAANFHALEDYTVDGTITGDLVRYTVTYSLDGVTSSNTSSGVGYTYQTVLSSTDGTPIYAVSVTMGGVNVTSDVYNEETGEINISDVTGNINIYGSTKAGPAPLYNLPQAKTFNGTSDYVDTGIKLFDTAKDFTIVCVADFSALNTANETLFHCMQESTPYPGLAVDRNKNSNALRIIHTRTASVEPLIEGVENVKALAIRYVAGALDCVFYKNASGVIVEYNPNASPKYTAITQNLILGAYQDTAGNKGRYYNGTINRFEVYDTALLNPQIEMLLQS